MIETYWEPNQAFIVGGGFSRTSWGFRDYPWKNMQGANLVFSTGYLNLRGTYFGEFRLKESAWTTRIDLKASGIDDLNFFGMGNETQPLEKSLYLTQEATLSAFPSLRFTPGSKFQLHLGAEVKYLNPQGDGTTLVEVKQPYGSGKFGELKLRTGFEFDTRGRSTSMFAKPTATSDPGAAAAGPKVSGVRALVEGFYAPKTWDVTEDFGGVGGSLAAYVGNRKVVFSVRGGGAKVWGAYPYFESASIGGSANVRGWDGSRFRGDSSLFGNAELRLWLGHRRRPAATGALGIARVLRHRPGVAEGRELRHLAQRLRRRTPGRDAGLARALDPGHGRLEHGGRSEDLHRQRVLVLRRRSLSSRLERRESEKIWRRARTLAADVVGVLDKRRFSKEKAVSKEKKDKDKDKAREQDTEGTAEVVGETETKPTSSEEKLSGKQYARAMRKLHEELVNLQEWVKFKGLKVCIVFEGRDGAGKGGTIKAITERVSPRVFRVIALSAPSDREKSQMYVQRYLPHFPGAGEVVIFDRSWYNRAGVERVMGFCTEEQATSFLNVVPHFEKLMVNSGIILLKYWLEVNPEEQTRRLSGRNKDGRKTWKLSPMDVKSYTRWDDYTEARDDMFAASDTAWAPWYVARSNDKMRVRLNIITHLLSQIPYEKVHREKVKLPKRKTRSDKSSYPFKFIPEAS